MILYKALIMKVSKLVLYALGGVIAGLLFENKSIRLKQSVADRATKLKNKATRLAKS